MDTETLTCFAWSLRFSAVVRYPHTLLRDILPTSGRVPYQAPPPLLLGAGMESGHWSRSHRLKAVVAAAKEVQLLLKSSVEATLESLWIAKIAGASE